MCKINKNGRKKNEIIFLFLYLEFLEGQWFDVVRVKWKIKVEFIE